VDLLKYANLDFHVPCFSASEATALCRSTNVRLLLLFWIFKNSDYYYWLLLLSLVILHNLLLIMVKL